MAYVLETKTELIFGFDMIIFVEKLTVFFKLLDLILKCENVPEYRIKKK